MKWFRESLYPTYGQTFQVKKVLVHKRTPFQDVLLFESESHGKVLVLDGVVQLTERDEHIYHEMLVHVPMTAHPAPKEVLVIGGGDGGALRRILMYPGAKVTLVEIDEEVVALSKKHLRKIHGGAFSDKRVEIVYADGADFIEHTSKKFDIIFTDRGDPIGPIKTLFEKEFYNGCKRILNKNGILVALTGVPFLQENVLKEASVILQKIFKVHTCYLVPVPTYIGGPLAITWSSDTLNPQKSSPALIRKRLGTIKTEFYNPEVHMAAFALPNNILLTINK